jgi:hypothetical protein
LWLFAADRDSIGQEGNLLPFSFSHPKCMLEEGQRFALERSVQIGMLDQHECCVCPIRSDERATRPTARRDQRSDPAPVVCVDSSKICRTG